MDSANTTNNNDSSNWRNELSQNSREKIVNKIMDTLQIHMPFTGPDGMNELKKITLRFEEKIYAAAVDQQDYLRKISLKMLSLRNHVSRDGNSLAGGSSSSNQEPLDPESGDGISLPEQPQPQEASLPQNEKVIMSASGMQNSAGLPSTLVTEIDANFGHPYHLSTEHVGLNIPLIEASVESSGQTGQSNVIDYQERIYQKLQRLKDIYFPDLRELFQRLSMKCQQPMAADQLDKLKLYRTKVHCMMQYFQVSKGDIPPGFPEDKIDAVEKQIQSVLDSFKPGKPALQQQQGHQQFLPESCSHLHSMQQESQFLMPQLQQQEKHSNQLQLMNLQASATSMQPNIVAPIQHSSMPQLQQQPFKTVPALSVCSPQFLPVVSPQVYQQSSPQLDQQGLVASSLPVPKLGTPMQPVTLPFTAPSPSTLPAPSPMEDAVKQSSAIPNIGSSQGLKQTTNGRSHSNSLAIGTPGIFALPLLASFSSNPAQSIVNQNGHQNVSPGPLMEDKLSTKEPPFEHLIKVVGQDMGVNEAIFESMKMGNTYDLFRQPLLTKYYRRLLFRALTLLSVLGFIAYVIYTSRANSS